jgi:TM2 domain-containing membrane protein YozV
MEITNLSKIVQQSFELLSREDKIRFETKFDANKKEVWVSFLLFFFLCSHYFYCGKLWTNIILIILIFCGIGFLWVLWDLVRLKAKNVVRDYNNELASDIIYTIQKESRYE